MNLQRIPQLDGWRGVSVLFVVAGHLANRRYGASPDIDVPSLAGVLSSIGVDIFFVISGFVITKLALIEFDETGDFSVINFYIRRFFRIIPPLIAYLAIVSFASSISLIEQSQRGLLTAAAFACNFPNIKCGWFAGHIWTLAYEEQFYILFPILFALAGRFVRLFFPLLLIVLAVFPLVRFFLHLGEGWRAAASFSPSFSFICIGAVLASYEDVVRNLSQGQNARLITWVTSILLLGLLLINAEFSFALGSKLAYLQRLLSDLLLPVCVAWLVASSIYQSNRFTSLLRARPLLFFGMISYSLYLWQQIFTAPPHLYLSKNMFTIPALMLVAATASHYFVERPSIAFGKKLASFSRPKARLPQNARAET